MNTDPVILPEAFESWTPDPIRWPKPDVAWSPDAVYRAEPVGHWPFDAPQHEYFTECDGEAHGGAVGAGSDAEGLQSDFVMDKLLGPLITLATYKASYARGYKFLQDTYGDFDLHGQLGFKNAKQVEDQQNLVNWNFNYS